MKTIATINFKGGVGKTTATWALGFVAAQQQRIESLAFDLDAQMSLTQAIALNEDGSPFKNFSDWYERCIARKKTIFDALDEFTKPSTFNFGINYDFIYRISERYHFVPSVETYTGQSSSSLIVKRSNTSSSGYWKRSRTPRTCLPMITSYLTAHLRLVC